jgi:probable rRNA maturation factor
MIDINNETNLNIPLEIINKITNSLTNKDIDLLVTNKEHIQEINLEFRDINKTTDVLSFPFEASQMMPLGSLVISADSVNEVSLNLEHTADDEFCLLYVHGLLHLLGFDHEVDEGQMRQKEEELINEFNLPKSLIIRVEG